MSERCHFADEFGDCGPAINWMAGHTHYKGQPCTPKCHTIRLCERCADVAVQVGRRRATPVVDHRW